MGKGTFSIIVNQTEAKAKTPSTDSQFLIPGFPASKLRAEKMVLSSYGLKLSNGKGKVIKYTYPPILPRRIHGIKFPRPEKKKRRTDKRKLLGADKDFTSLDDTQKTEHLDSFFIIFPS